MFLSSLEDMIRFAKSVKEWLKADPENVIVVHCKGGKGKNYIIYLTTKFISCILGRTGTMICVWLVEAGVFSSATESLDYFGNRRTDTNVSKKFQGVSHNSNRCSYNQIQVCYQTLIFNLGRNTLPI